MVDPAALRRHDLVYLSPEAWRDQVASVVDEVADWADLGRPAILRQRVCADPDGVVPLGLPLPPGMGRKRLTLSCSPAAVARVASPPSLRDARSSAPAGWRPVIEALLGADPSWRCFGSLAWQHVTRLSYLTDASDLDLLITCVSHAEATRVAAALGGIAAWAPMRLDAELVSEGGNAVQWREWLSDAPHLLVKTRSGPALVAREALFP
ncbi:malonate decarboxylase holo-[acyl-carrier-protein] synthase [Nitrospirillum sp. BR 11163]|uniref:malonate decarboxylase holo-[acyl-carrier-protein] synthase n=1 Tax=Nitrospirillum sp. BR 11163 TaxID=3104323 RepID=UPI002AFF185F|nr:malonate decarboxylase holo-[acyl-carrier-protein] synthase [Nitrospirillum sp. BR 11163]MEA1672105.1 malonate decarboxylase holo-[acyl-carrier-protein] synthase [Nitrospirillum sp. BR 11163]